MPGFGRRGPMGTGPMTGRGRGFGNYAPRKYRRFSGFGYGRGGRLGRDLPGNQQGRGAFAWWPPQACSGLPEDPAGDLEELKAQADSLRDCLDAIRQRMAELEKTSE